MMHELLMALGRGALAAGLALAFVLAVRVPARRWLGAGFAYRLWLLVPVAALATLLPAPVRPLIPVLQVAQTAPSSSAAIELQAAVMQASSFDWRPWLLALWIAGALALVVVFTRQQHRYLKSLGALSAGDEGALRAQATDGCPALVGALRPRIVVPSDFESRYTPRERELVLAHERTHLARGDAQINAFAALLRCLNWFNPLFHLAASRFRFDQEIACDAAVMSRFPEARRCYADAMLKAQLVGSSRQELRLPAGCHWPQSHPLKERIAMLKFPILNVRRRVLAGAVIVSLTLAAGYASWAAQPGSVPAGPPSSATKSVALSSTAMVQTDFSISIDGNRIGGNDRAEQSRMQEGGQWNLAFDTTKDGVVTSRVNGNMGILNRFGDAFKFSASRDGELWEVEGTARDLLDGTIEFDGTIRQNGSIASRPVLVVHDKVPTAIEVGDRSADGKFKGFKIDITLHKVDGPAARELAGGAGPDVTTAPTEDLTYRRMYPPKYPREAVLNRITGKVILKVAVDEHGVPTSAEVKSLKPDESARMLADAAIAAAMKWRFNPGLEGDKPVAGSVHVPFDFNMTGDNNEPVPPSDPVADASVSYRRMRPPVYPQEMIASKISGSLYVRAHIDAGGNVTDAYVDQALPESALALKDSALAAVKGWQFNPATRNGQASESDVLVPMQFRIEGEATEASSKRAAPPLTAYPDSVRKLEAIVVTGAAS